MTALLARLGGEGLFARAARSVGFTALGYGASQGLRLASNLILTRLLYPEAFGLMALVSVFLVGLSMFSDFGLGPAVMRSPRGEEPDFLNTAWTLQAIRGALLWLGACALAIPAAAFYGAPELAGLLPVAALTLLIAGFNPIRIETANRRLMLGRVTALDLASQAAGIAAMVVLAVITRSVWALAAGAVAGAAAKLVLTHAFLPGARERLRLERAAVGEIVHFSKWILMSTALGFLITQGDKAILGRYLTLETLGVYNIGFFLASFPIFLGSAVIGRVMIPLYRESPPDAAPANFRRLRRMRFGLTGGLLALILVMAWVGPPLVALLFDDRYLAAGPIVTAIALTQIPAVIGMSYDQSALAAGNSRGFFALTVFRAAVQIGFFVAGLELAGLPGAFVGQAVGLTAAHPAIALLARRHGAWDPLHDLAYAAAGLALGGLAFLHWREALAAIGS